MVKMISEELTELLEKRAGGNINEDVYYELELIDDYGGQWAQGVEWKGYDVYSSVFTGEPPVIGLPLAIMVKDGEARMTTPEESLEYLKYARKTKRNATATKR